MKEPYCNELMRLSGERLGLAEHEVIELKTEKRLMMSAPIDIEGQCYNQHIQMECEKLTHNFPQQLQSIKEMTTNSILSMPPESSLLNNRQSTFYFSPPPLSSQQQ